MLLTVIAAAMLGGQNPTVDLDKYIFPLSPAHRSPKFVIDVKAAPETKAWAEKAAKVASAWYPHICELLATKNCKDYKTIRLVFRPKQDAPAWASGDEISVSSDWVNKHPEDLGMIVHELTHVVQSYKDNKVDVGWLVEGIADYVRWWRYEPEAPRSKITAQNSYKDAYRVTAAFIAWLMQNYDRRILARLDAKLRVGEDPMPVFQETTGKTVDQLWKEFTK